ncbi:MAG: lipoprotein [Bermanella sp.]
MRYLVILAVLWVAGCGQKGALFLPEEPLEELSKEQPEKTVETKPSI